MACASTTFNSPAALAAPLLAAGMLIASCSAPPQVEVEGTDNPASSTAATGSATASSPASVSSTAKTTTKAKQECEHPRLDLLETEYGLWGMAKMMHTEHDGQDNKQWLHTSTVENHFDPCAKFSYAVVTASPPEYLGSQIPARQVVLFFSGEHLILEQKMPLIDEVRGVEINGSTATVDYRADDYSAGLEGLEPDVDYRMTYQLSPHEVVEEGQHVRNRMGEFERSDFDRFPPPGDSFWRMPMGNENYQPWDYSEEWVGNYVTVPIGDTSMRCALLGSVEYQSVSLIECLAYEDIFPPVDTRLSNTPLEAPGEDSYFVATIDFSMPVSVYTDNKLTGNASSHLEMEDEAVTRVGNVIFDTRGDQVFITNFDWNFMLSPGGVTQEKAPGINDSRWPTDLEPFMSN